MPGFPAVMVRRMSTSSGAASKPKKKAAKGEGEKKQVVVNSYWGIEQSNKLLPEDGTEWKWTCFRVRTCLPQFVRSLNLDSVLPLRRMDIRLVHVPGVFS